MSNEEYTERDCTVFIGNIHNRVTEEIIFELFLQAGPLDRVTIPKDKESGAQQSYGFAIFTSPVSVSYAIDLLDGTALYGQRISVKQRNGSSTPSTPNGSQTPPLIRGSPLQPMPLMRQNSYEQNFTHQYGRHTPPHLISQHRPQEYMRQRSYDGSRSYYQGRNTPPARFTQQQSQEYNQRTRNNQDGRSSRY